MRDCCMRMQTMYVKVDRGEGLSNHQVKYDRNVNMNVEKM